MRKVFLHIFSMCLTSCVVALFSSNYAVSQTSIDYTVSFDTKKELANVTAMLNGVTSENIKFYFPIWAPGAYDIVNFGAKVNGFKVQSLSGTKGNIVAKKIDSNTFIFPTNKSGSLKVTYSVKDFEYDSRSAWFALSDIENKFAFANGTALFGYVDGKKNIPFSVKYNLPKGWDMAYGLDLAANETTKYIAKDYDEIADAPIFCGNFQRIDFSINSIPHTIAIIAPKQIKPDNLKRIQIMAEKVVKAETDFFKDMPYKRYVFQVYLENFGRGDFGFGALEHSNSSAYRMPFTEEENLDKDLMGVFAHEFFHLWSPKRVHVSELGPFDYQRAPRTKSLWFHEGVTEYYARLIPVRYGISTQKDFLQEMKRDIIPLSETKQTRTITDLSEKITEATMFQLMGLYTKGPALAFMLDATIRQQTNNKKSLDDALIFFNNEYGKKNKTFSDDDIIPIMEQATGTKLQEFYNNYINGLSLVPVKSLLPAVGLRLGGRKEWKEEVGASFDFSKSDGYAIKSISPGSAFEKLGFKVGDVIKSWNKSTVDGKTMINVKKVNGETLQTEMTKIEVETNDFTVDEKASPETLAARKKMMGF